MFARLTSVVSGDIASTMNCLFASPSPVYLGRGCCPQLPGKDTRIRASAFTISGTSNQTTQAMCVTVSTKLSCGHTKQAAIIRCVQATNTSPQGPPRDDGRLVRCQPGEVFNVDQNAYCEACFAHTLRGLIVSLCQTCQSGVLERMGRALLELMSPARSPEDQQPTQERQRSPEERRRSSSDESSQYHWRS
ncbi:hypothetical protein DOTSEDRAFT_74246 [Dothistroma septosporum NZE10]|uniref:Uncharacterized protein n=1 Tax=Dothistroma septosporum (strain NZE10 / CBS 128990) TaxID=675120 RepID=N1PEV8_DOTSN|nr:hypothetical protein DOTSEDRAFT_74246 [Dothistroma septosporum NZE10]